MGLPNPVPGVDPGPDYALNLQTCLSTIDGHNHASGSGVQINPNGININSALPFNGNPATLFGYLGISPQGVGVATPINDSLYCSGVDLYFQDGNGNPIQITSGGSVNATSSGIASGTALATFVSSILVVTQSTGVGAAIDAATYILRYNGSYPSPSGNYILLSAPSSLATGYQITFPAITPASNGSFLTSNTAGVWSYSNVDGVTLSWSAGTLSVPTSGISTAQIGANQVTGAKLNSNVADGSTIVYSASALSIPSNVNLPGNAAQENGLNLVTSSTNASTSLKMIRGYIEFDGTTLAGEGFSCARIANGAYTITFSSAFASTPAVTATVAQNVAAFAVAYSPSTTQVSIVTATVGSSPTDTNYRFSFIAIGPR